MTVLLKFICFADCDEPAIEGIWTHKESTKQKQRQASMQKPTS